MGLFSKIKSTKSVSGYSRFISDSRARTQVSAGGRVGIEHIDGSENELFLHVRAHGHVATRLSELDGRVLNVQYWEMTRE